MAVRNSFHKETRGLASPKIATFAPAARGVNTITSPKVKVVKPKFLPVAPPPIDQKLVNIFGLDINKPVYSQKKDKKMCDVKSKFVAPHIPTYEKKGSKRVWYSKTPSPNKGKTQTHFSRIPEEKRVLALNEVKIQQTVKPELPILLFPKRSMSAEAPEFVSEFSPIVAPRRKFFEDDDNHLYHFLDIQLSAPVNEPFSVCHLTCPPSARLSELLDVPFYEPPFCSMPLMVAQSGKQSKMELQDESPIDTPEKVAPESLKSPNEPKPSLFSRATSFVPSLPSVKVGLDEVSKNLINKAIDTIESTTQVFNNTLSSFKNLIQKLVTDESLPGLLIDKLLLAIVSLMNFYSSNDTKSRMLTIASFLLGLGIPICNTILKGVAAFISIVSKFFKGKTEVDVMVTQAGRDHQSLISDIHDATTTVASTVLGPTYSTIIRDVAASFYSNVRSSFSLTSLGKAFGSIRNVAMGIEIIFKYVKSFFGMIYEKIFGLPFVTDESEAVVKKAVDWMTKASTLTLQSKEADMLLKMDFHNSIIAHYSQGTLILNEVQEAGYNKMNFSSLFKVYDLFKRLADSSYGFVGLCRRRPEPIWVDFTGEPGVGKSTISPDFCDRMYTQMCAYTNTIPEKDRNSYIFQDGAEQRFYDGYAGQPIIEKDDFNQHDDKEERTQIAFNIIRMINPAPFTMPCADPSKIGTMPCNCRLLVTTSNSVMNNTMKINKLNLESVDAFNRRCTLCVQVVLREGYYDTIYKKDGVIRTPKQGMNASINEMYDFYLWSRLTGKRITDKKFTYQDICNLAWTRMLSKIQDFEKLAFKKKPEDFKVRALSAEEMNQIFFAQSGKQGTMNMESYTESSDDESDDDESPPSFNEKTLFDGTNTVIFNPKSQTWSKYYPEPIKTDYWFPVVDNFQQEMKAFVAPDTNNKHPWLSIILKSIGVLLTMWSVYMIYQWFTDSQEVPVAEAGAVTVIESYSKPVHPRKGVNFKPHPAFHVQSGTTTLPPRDVVQIDNIDMIIAKVSKNLFRVHIADNPEMKGFWYCNGVSFGGRTLQVPLHMLDRFLSKADSGCYFDCYIRLYNKKHGVRTFYLGAPNVLCVPDTSNDRVSISAKELPQCAEIVKHCITESSYHDSNLSDLVVVGIPSYIDDKVGEDYLLDRRYCSDGRKLSPIDSEGNELRYNYFMLDDVKKQQCPFSNDLTLLYGITNEQGLCFSFVLTTNPYADGKIVALHGAGSSNSKLAYGLVVTREYVKSFQDHSQKIHPVSDPALIAQSGLSEVLVEASTKAIGKFDIDLTKFELLGVVDNKKYHRIQTQTQIEPMPIQGIVGKPEKRPPNFKPYYNEQGELVKPIANSLNLFANTPESPDCILSREEIYHVALELLHRVPERVPWRKLSDTEMVMGVDSWKFVKRIDMSKAAGINLTGLPKNPTTGKYYLFSITRDKYNVITDLQPRVELLDRIDTLIEEFSSGVFHGSPAQLNPKDELVSPRKENLPRLFSTHECALNLLGRRYFGSFVENYLLAIDEVGCTLGVNPHSSAQWDFVLRGHRVHSPKLQVGDVKSADRDKSREVTIAANHALIDFLLEKKVINKEEWNIAYGCLAAATTDASVQIEDVILRVLGVITSSGFFLTGVYQSYYYKVVHHCAFVSANKRLMKASTQERNDYIRNVCKSSVIDVHLYSGVPDDTVFDDRKHGDDFLNFVNSQYSWFTCHCLAYELSTFKCNITPALKTAEFKDFYTSEEVDYLQRQFIYRHQKRRAPLKKQTIIEVTNWIGSLKVPFKKYIEDLARWASLELAHWDEVTYKELASKFDRFLEVHGSYKRMPTYFSATWYLDHNVANQNVYGMLDDYQEDFSDILNDNSLVELPPLIAQSGKRPAANAPKPSPVPTQGNIHLFTPPKPRPPIVEHIEIDEQFSAQVGFNPGKVEVDSMADTDPDIVNKSTNTVIEGEWREPLVFTTVPTPSTFTPQDYALSALYGTHWNQDEPLVPGQSVHKNLIIPKCLVMTKQLAARHSVGAFFTGIVEEYTAILDTAGIRAMLKKDFGIDDDTVMSAPIPPQCHYFNYVIIYNMTHGKLPEAPEIYMLVWITDFHCRPAFVFGAMLDDHTCPREQLKEPCYGERTYGICVTHFPMWNYEVLVRCPNPYDTHRDPLYGHMYATDDARYTQEYALPGNFFYDKRIIHCDSLRVEKHWMFVEITFEQRMPSGANIEIARVNIKAPRVKWNRALDSSVQETIGGQIHRQKTS